MSAYLKKAEKANTLIKEIMQDTCDIHPDLIPKLLENLLRLYNLGIRTAPRPTLPTVRLRAVETAAKGFPVHISMTRVPGYIPGRPFNCLTITRPNQTETLVDQDQDVEDVSE